MLLPQLVIADELQKDILKVRETNHAAAPLVLLHKWRQHFGFSGKVNMRAVSRDRVDAVTRGAKRQIAHVANFQCVTRYLREHEVARRACCQNLPGIDTDETSTSLLAFAHEVRRRQICDPAT